MYISDKNLVKIVIFPYFLGTLALNGITKNTNEFFKLCEICYLEILDKYQKKDKLAKLNNRLDILTNKAIYELANKQTSEVNTHKAIIVINEIAQMAIDANLFDYEMQAKIASLLEPFQEIETRMNISDDDWLMLKNSAEKQAKKIYEIFFKE
jgi:hypothetical protein